MIYRFYQDRANAHIAELEQEAKDARLARRREVHLESKLPYLTGMAARLVTQLRRLPGSRWLGIRELAGPLLVSPQCEFDPVADYSNPACELLGGASHNAGSPGLRSASDDSTLRFEDSHFHDTGITNIDPRMSFKEDEFASTNPRIKEEHSNRCNSKV